MATRRQGLKRIKKRRLSERSEFPTLPVSGPGGACSPCEARTAIVGAAFFAPLFGGAKKRVGRRDEHPATPHGSELCNASPARLASQRRFALAGRMPGCHCSFAAKCCTLVKQRSLSCRTTKPGAGPAAGSLLLLRQEK